MEMNNANRAHEEESSKWTGTYTWPVQHWSQLTEEKIYSPEFEIGGYSWRLMVCPRGSSGRRRPEYISVYLYFPEASYTPPQMCPKAKFELIARKINCPKESRRREATHAFSNRKQKCGFTHFFSLQVLLNPYNGYLVNNTLTLSVNINLGKIDGILGSISRIETGFTGIKSFRGTSLLSSFLQCLFHIKVFRRAVFQMPTEEHDDPQKSLPMALQHLFYKLQYQRASVEAKDLMRALDWNCLNAHSQHDVHTIQHAIFEKLAKDSRASSTIDCISELFVGEHSTCIQSPSIKGTQISKQSFIETSLDVLECKDIYSSLEKWCQIQRLEKDNRNHEKSRGACQSRHYTLFDSFPVVLLFHLKRCYYNPDRCVFLKLNSHLEFYDELDLDCDDCVLLSKNADRTIENKYRLHSVVVHAGSPNKGRYFTFIRCDEKWCKFDGEVVKVVTAEEAINAQFGDRDGQVSANFSRGFKSSGKSTVVMLVYIRRSEWERVICDARKEDISKQVRESFDKEQVENEEQQKKKEARLYVNLQLATEFHFTEQIGKDYYFDLPTGNDVKNYRIYKKTPFEDFKEMVSKDFGIPKFLQRFWLWSQLTEETMRVSNLLMEGKDGWKSVLDLRHFRDKAPPLEQEEDALMTIKLFLESPDEASLDGDISRKTLHPIQRNELLNFVKYYDPETSKLSYLGHMFIDKNCPFFAIFEKAKRMAGLDLEEEVIGFKEVKHLPNVICSNLDPDVTPEMNEMIQGDIIIIQKVSKNHHYEFPTVRVFLEFIQNSNVKIIGT